MLFRSDGCARHATTLTDNPLVAWNVVAGAANTQGCQLELSAVQARQYPDWFTRALADNPGSLHLRCVMLLNLRTEWGGSEEHMLTFLRQQQEDGQLGQTDMQRLWAEFHGHVSHHAMHFARDLDRAIERASLAADLHPPKADQLFIALTGASSPGPARLAALRRFLQAAGKDPTVTLSGNFYWALARAASWIQPELPGLRALMVRDLQQGDPESAVWISRLRRRHPAWDLPDPLPALRRLAESCGVRAGNDRLLQVLQAAKQAENKTKSVGLELPIARQALWTPDAEASWRRHGFPELSTLLGYAEL